MHMVRKCHHIFAHPKKKKKSILNPQGTEKFVNFFVNVVFTCTYYIVFHTSFALFGCKYRALVEPTEGLTH